MDAPLIARVFLKFLAFGLQSSIRPFVAVFVTAGPDGIRESNAYSP